MIRLKNLLAEQVAPFGDQQRAQLDTLKNPYGIKKTSASANVKTGITEPENIMPNWVSKSTLKRYATNILDEWKHNDAYFVSILIADIFNKDGSFMKNFKTVTRSAADTPGDFNFGTNMKQTVKLAKEFSNHFKNWWHTVIEPYRGTDDKKGIDVSNWKMLDSVYSEILHKIGDDPRRSSGENTFQLYGQQILDLAPWAKIPPISTSIDRMRKVKWSIVNSDGKTRTHFIINTDF